MAAPVPLTIAALALTGVGAGLYLGKSAIAEIDPIYFSSPYDSSSTFYADLVPGGAKFDPPPARLQDASLASGLGSGCILCPAAAEIQAYSGPDYEAYDAYGSSAVTYASYVEFPAEDVVEEAEDAVDVAHVEALRDVERYAHYPVSAEETPPVRLASENDEAESPKAASAAAALRIDEETTPGI